MQYLECPVIGRRPYAEFAISGPLEPERGDLPGVSAATWTFGRSSVPRVRVEWWYHVPSQLWFEVTRDTAADTVLDAALAGASAGRP